LAGLAKAGDKLKDARKKAAEALKKRKKNEEGGSCPAKGKHSFLPGTKVLLAGGKAKPIEKVRLGDKITVTDPKTGGTTVREVVGTIVTEDDKHFVDLTIKGSTGKAEGLVSTTTHPFWSDSERAWIEAGDLKPGMRLHSAEGESVEVTAIRAFDERQRTHDLTVEDVHTYYVRAGETALLVHNCGDEDEYQIEDHVEPRHVAGGDENVEGKSTFAPELSDRASLVNLASQSKRHVGRVQAETGRVRWVINTGRNMGTDEHGLPTTMLTIVRENAGGWDAGNLVTMHPGLPRDLTRPFVN
jgi:hypothetical protein